ncbi:hypothetical protein [Deinococcus aquiradiocola]|uniref:Lipoprotein n=1 Tax=Deinococcus aquiradiocola TaxID=393059 RepID=A0A917PHN3_9DEIO|nr:hypothetical protein [Deinococcus aquiradiocola]GGJ78556.1 hypothetical protein GCM10008939_23060 [Deinococcus aquiradiocola]
MKYGVITVLFSSLVAVLMACGTAPSTPAASGAGRAAPDVTVTALRPVGLVELGTQDGLDAQTISDTTVGGFTFTRLGGTTVLEDGIYRYLSARYRVRNVGAVARRNVTLLTVSTPATYPNTAVKSIKLANGTEASFWADHLRPTSGMRVGNAGPEVDPAGASLQLFRRDEVRKLDGQGGILQAFPWGYVVTPDQGGRTLLPGGEGSFTVALKVRKADFPSGPVNFSLVYVVVTDDLTRVTVAPEELNLDRVAALSETLKVQEPGVSVSLVHAQHPFLAEPSQCVGCNREDVGDVPISGPFDRPSMTLLPTKSYRLSANMDYSDLFSYQYEGTKFLNGNDYRRDERGITENNLSVFNALNCTFSSHGSALIGTPECTGQSYGLFEHRFEEYFKIYNYNCGSSSFYSSDIRENVSVAFRSSRNVDFRLVKNSNNNTTYNESYVSLNFDNVNEYAPYRLDRSSTYSGIEAGPACAAYSSTFNTFVNTAVSTKVPTLVFRLPLVGLIRSSAGSSVSSTPNLYGSVNQNYRWSVDLLDER